MSERGPEGKQADGDGKVGIRPLVLVVDDSEENRELFATLVDSAGYDVITASDGVSAVDAAIASLPALILMDVSMPQMDGWEAARRIRAVDACAKIHIIALTALGDAESRRRSHEAGCNEHLVKSISAATLLASIRRALGASDG